MAIFVYWDDEFNTLLRTEFIGTWTWEDYGSAMKQSTRFPEGIDHHFNHIMDMSEADTLPSGSTPDLDWEVVNNQKGKTIFVGKPAYVKSFLALFAKDYEARCIRVETLDEAYRLIYPS